MISQNGAKLPVEGTIISWLVKLYINYLSYSKQYTAFRVGFVGISVMLSLQRIIMEATLYIIAMQQLISELQQCDVMNISQVKGLETQ